MHSSMNDRLEASLQELEARMLIPPDEIDVLFVKLEYLVSNSESRSSRSLQESPHVSPCSSDVDDDSDANDDDVDSLDSDASDPNISSDLEFSEGESEEEEEESEDEEEESEEE